jgi:N-acetyltransferase 10
MGFGARALEALNAFYNGEYANLDEVPKKIHSIPFETAARQYRVGCVPCSIPSTNTNHVYLQGSTLLEEQLAVRDVESMPPLLQRLSEVQPPSLDYLGVSYGLIASLLKFWKKSGYVPLYVRQTPNDLTGEFTMVMIRGVGHGEGSSKSPRIEWLTEFAKGLHRLSTGRNILTTRLLRFPKAILIFIILPVPRVWQCSGSSSDRSGQWGCSRSRGKGLALGGILCTSTHSWIELPASELSLLLTPFDVKRLESYANNQLDYHVILDLLPTLATLYFDRRMTALRTNGEDGDDASKEKGVKLSALQSAMLLAMGLQRKTVEEVGEELSLDVNQVLAQFTKITKKMTGFLQGVQRASVLRELPQAIPAGEAQPNTSTIRAIEDDLADAAQEVRKEITARTLGPDDTTSEQNKLKERQREMLDALDLSK